MIQEDFELAINLSSVALLLNIHEPNLLTVMQLLFINEEKHTIKLICI